MQLTTYLHLICGAFTLVQALPIVPISSASVSKRRDTDLADASAWSVDARQEPEDKDSGLAGFSSGLTWNPKRQDTFDGIVNNWQTFPGGEA
ncbi:hypothetical protein MMC10_001567 [Thelotrema lepadinum]|nr:hypothetical protein [Thelotrema lepadinum]